jgi:hypothetical protein
VFEQAEAKLESFEMEETLELLCHNGVFLVE